MFFQKFVKGIHGLSDVEADLILTRTGIMSNLWRNSPNGTLDVHSAQRRLTERELSLHLDRYNAPHPDGGQVRDKTPFVSLAAGTVDRQRLLRRNVPRPAHLTALRFATDQFRGSGHLFFGWVACLEKPSVSLEQFAEDVRDLHSYTAFRRYHLQGEVTAKLCVPPVQLERVERWTPMVPHLPLAVRVWSAYHIDYETPEDHTNLRYVL